MSSTDKGPLTPGNCAVIFVDHQPQMFFGAAAQDTALRRVEQAGGVSVTAPQVLLEFQRDWARLEHCDEARAIVKERCYGYGHSTKRRGRTVHSVPANGKRKESQRSAKRKEINT
jgi:hypothetical protein